MIVELLIINLKVTIVVKIPFFTLLKKKMHGRIKLKVTEGHKQKTKKN